MPLTAPPLPAADRRVWAAMIWPAGIADVFGALRFSPRLHWTQQAARREAERWVAERQAERAHPARQIRWEALDDHSAIGRLDDHVVLLSSILLPEAEAPS